MHHYKLIFTGYVATWVETKIKTEGATALLKQSANRSANWGIFGVKISSMRERNK